MDVIKYFRVSELRASKIIKIVKKSVSNWQNVAKKYGIPRGEREVMSKAFRIE